MIRVQLPDGNVREVASGTTPLEIAESISPRLAQVVVVAKIKPLAGLDLNLSEGGQDDAPPDVAQSAEMMYGAGDPEAEKVVDLTAPLTEDVALWLLKESDPESLKVMRHSAAHVLATAVMELFPETKLGHGPRPTQAFSTTFTVRRRSRTKTWRPLKSAWPRWLRAMKSLCVSRSRGPSGLKRMSSRASL